RPRRRGASGARADTGRARRPASTRQPTARIMSAMAAPASGLRRLMAHRVRVLLHLLRGQVLLLPLPHLIEAGEAMDIAEGVTLEALIEVGLGDRSSLPELAREVVHRLDGRAERRPGGDGHRDPLLVHPPQAEPRRPPRLVVDPRPMHFLADPPPLVHARRPLYEGHVGPRLQIGVGAANRFVEATPVGAPRVG